MFSVTKCSVKHLPVKQSWVSCVIVLSGDVRLHMFHFWHTCNIDQSNISFSCYLKVVMHVNHQKHADYGLFAAHCWLAEMKWSFRWGKPLVKVSACVMITSSLLKNKSCKNKKIPVGLFKNFDCLFCQITINQMLYVMIAQLDNYATIKFIYSSFLFVFEHLLI